MKHSVFCLLLLSVFTSCSLTAQEPLFSRTVERDSTEELYLYYPEFTALGLVCDSMPYHDTSVVMCVEAAYTHAIRRKFSHDNIDGCHVCDGMKYMGADCKDNTGMFTCHNGKWRFVYPAAEAAMDSAATDSCGMGFGQTMLIYHKNLLLPVRNLKQVAHFRALCEKEGRLCVIDSKDTVTFGHFLYLLASCGVDNALYLDMGRGWNHSWYREKDGTLREIYPYSHPYCTNWMVFRRRE